VEFISCSETTKTNAQSIHKKATFFIERIFSTYEHLERFTPVAHLFSKRKMKKELTRNLAQLTDSGILSNM
jgi:hypothetical protein